MGLRVVMSGFTAAGKSTHSHLLAEDLKIPYVSAAAHLAELMAGRTGSTDHTRWQQSFDEVRSTDSSIDDELDAYMINQFESSTDGIFDACLLPWLAPTVDAIRVWIESDEPSRIRKYMVRHQEDEVDYENAATVVAAKDAFTASRLQTSCGTIYRPDPDYINVVVNNTKLISTPSREEADQGIELLRPVLLDAVLYVAGLQPTFKASDLIVRAVRPDRT